jgi:hypothetical protein
MASLIYLIIRSSHVPRTSIQQDVLDICLTYMSQISLLVLLFSFIDPPVINFTQSVYDVNEDRKAVIGISVTQGKVIAPLTVRYVIYHFRLSMTIPIPFSYTKLNDKTLAKAKPPITTSNVCSYYIDQIHTLQMFFLQII